MAAGPGSPCGACKFLRRKCAPDCLFAPYFCSEQGVARFAAIHKVFGASNVSKLLSHLPVPDRCEAVVTIAYEAQARIRDPVYGCVAHIFAMQQQVAYLQAQLMQVKAQLANTSSIDESRGNITNIQDNQWPMGIQAGGGSFIHEHYNYQSNYNNNYYNNNNNKAISSCPQSSFDSSIEQHQQQVGSDDDRDHGMPMMMGIQDNHNVNYGGGILVGKKRPFNLVADMGELQQLALRMMRSN
ncbi:hypothetical protein Cgig2_033006 [Carnegiea gigantea]|uniref:LOB domain-containing protein n=1 Tax=Carnegiea gigantea TaxID=171969 RepID=A0A9Q1K7J1_9CARY|nr:hypothetical protein Cgig2_033006 [Carnegiea gigantea]